MIYPGHFSHPDFTDDLGPQMYASGGVRVLLIIQFRPGAIYEKSILSLTDKIQVFEDNQQ
jgi:hypothetical protein